MSEEEKKENKKTQKLNTCLVISVVNYPMMIEYDREQFKLSPNQILRFEDKSKLKGFPKKGILLKDIGG